MFNIDEMRFVLNREKLKSLAKFRGWKAIYTVLADEMGFSASYCRRVVLGREKLTDLFMLKYIKLCGCNPKKPAEWGALFEPILDGKLPEYHSAAMNGLKMNAHGIKYRWGSPAHEFRKHWKEDHPNVEVETLEESLKTPGRARHS